MRAAWLLLFPCLALAWPFGKAGPEELEVLRAKAGGRYPSGRYVWAIGVSERSPDEAQARARAGVAGQLDLQVRSVLTSRLEETRRQDKGELSGQVVWEAREESRFERAHLIRCEPAVRTAEGWAVVASLSRRDAVEGMVAAYEDSARRLGACVRTAREVPDLEGFVASWQEATRLGEWVRAQERQARLVSGGAEGAVLPGYARHMDLLDRLEEERRRRLGAQKVVLRVEGGQRERLRRLLRTEGLVPVDDSARWELRLEWRKEEAESVVGEIMRCRLLPVLELREASVLRGRREGGAVEAVRVRDVQGACAQAAGRRDEAALEADWRALLAGSFPIP